MRHDDTIPPIVALLTPEERWTRAEERWTRQQRRFARGRAAAPIEPTLDAIPTAVAYKDLTPREREHRARTATPEEHALLYPEMHAFRQSMKPKTALGAWACRAVVVLLLTGGLVMGGYGFVTMGTDPSLQDAGVFIIGGAALASAAFPFAEGVGAWDEEQQIATDADRDLASRV